MKLRFRSALPPLDRAARLPLVLCALRAGALTIQFVVRDEAALPLPGPVGRRAGPAPPVPEPKRSDDAGVILARAMFAPAGGPPGSGAGQVAGRKIAGSIKVGRAVFVVVQEPDGRTVSVPVGGRIGDWRLQAVRASEALLERGGERIIVPFGAGTPLPADATATGSGK
ncbi:MAG: hypothetical protein P8Y58_16335 [Novosphingobium sp.]